MDNQTLAEFRNAGREKIRVNENKVRESEERLWEVTSDTPLNQRFELQSNLYQAYLELFVLEYKLYLSAGELDRDFQRKHFDRTSIWRGFNLFRHWNLKIELSQHHIMNTRLMNDIGAYVYKYERQARTQSRVRIYFDIQSGESSLILQNRFFTKQDLRWWSSYSELEKTKKYGLNQVRFTLMLYHRICTDLAKIEDWDRLLRLL